MLSMYYFLISFELSKTFFAKEEKLEDYNLLED